MQTNNPRQYSVFGALVRAPFFSQNIARDMAHNWRGIGLRLLFLALLLSWIIEGITWDRAFKGFAANDFPKVVEDFPPITIKDGVVSSPVDQPFYMKDKESGKTFAVLDTTGTINSLDDADGAFILLTENKLIYHDSSNPGQTKIQDLSQIKNFYIDRPIVTNWVSWGARWAAVVVVPICFIGSLIYRIIQGLIYAAFGMIWNSTFNARLQYPALLRLTFLSITPVLILTTVLSVLKIDIPMLSLICLVIAQIYLAMAVKANEQAPAPPAYGYGAPPYAPPMPANPFNPPPGGK
jgi:hypothetical protein